MIDMPQIFRKGIARPSLLDLEGFGSLKKQGANSHTPVAPIHRL